MADNVVASAGSGGSTFAAASLTFSGDTAVVPGTFVGILSGSEGAWTWTLNVGGAGAVTAGTQRITLASDDPAVVALQIIDDWDESDRAKVNLIVGQAGVAAGAGAVGATVQRVTLASDDPGVALLTTIDADTGSILTAVQLIDDAIFADDAAFTLASSKTMVGGAVRDDALATLTAIEGDVVPLRVGSTGALWVGVEGTVTVGSHAVTNAGTFAVQAAQSGTWNITNVSGTVSLPTGAATAAKQPALGTAGTASTDVITVQGIALMTPLLVTLSGTNNVTNAGTFAVQAVCTNAGTFAVQVDGSALTALQLIDDAIFTDDTTTFTPATTKGILTGGVVDDDTTDAADEGDLVAFRATKERKQRVVAAIDSEYMQSGNDQVVPKFAIIDAATSGDNTLVAAVASKKLRVLSVFLVSAGTVTVRFESGAGGTALTGQMNLVVNSGFVLPFNPVGWFETAAAALLNLELSGAVSVDGSITYIEVD